MKWYPITSLEDVETIIDRSRVTPCLIFKHSTTCPISSIAKKRLEMEWDFGEEDLEAYYLDLHRFRSVSNHIADHFGVEHESPQVLVIREGKATHDASHLSIRANALLPA
ncbi:bacillithiol system redox-active protein YtxJ [Lewinella sp. W8]|uniref:bacillithiol system redox-active protein YtxJ n=1 Tax=Lewinella sp. W8 TaxID=2528208 RepID=UPI0010688521|nr:bacillithiol system redox-active protein YtxJ [Lewinella sp. W8]MTB49844.1 bacillithiol system redox-active protein YtxJ [Lewinella sp. W8]